MRVGDTGGSLGYDGILTGEGGRLTGGDSNNGSTKGNVLDTLRGYCVART